MSMRTAAPPALQQGPLAPTTIRTVEEVDDALHAIADVLDLLRGRVPPGSQARIFVEAAATATSRATALTRRLLRGE